MKKMVCEAQTKRIKEQQNDWNISNPLKVAICRALKSQVLMMQPKAKKQLRKQNMLLLYLEAFNNRDPLPLKVKSIGS